MALKIVVETWQRPPPITFSSDRLLMIAPAYAYPRSTVTGPSSSQNEKVCPGMITTPSNCDAPVEMFAERGDPRRDGLVRQRDRVAIAGRRRDRISGDRR